MKLKTTSSSLGGNKTYPTRIMDPPKFVFEPSELQSFSSQPISDLLPTLVPLAQSLARPPISNYRVGAVGIGSSGRIFFGVNLEFPGLPLHHSVHAEQFLITNLNINGESCLRRLAVSAAPCGHCRQFLQELRHAQETQIVITDNEDKKYESLGHFLPHRFGPDDLLDKDVPLLLEPHDNGLVLKEEGQNGTYTNSSDYLKIAALEAANKSHAAYSKCPSGVALVDCEGKVYKGSYTESAAYNPSLGPVQAALVDYIVKGGGEYERIVRAVLVEKRDVAVKQECTAKMLLEVIAPKSHFRVFHCVQRNKAS